ncbi:MAG: hypothetical protein WC095_02335 [Candidatus Paceibacterota bacterium]
MTNIQEDNIHLAYKNTGETPKECLERYKSENPNLESVPMTYAGRLDPMAEGVLILLSGEAIEKKEDFLDLPKTYVFEILWGVKTDTGDVLGLIDKEEEKIPKEEDVRGVLEKSLGDFIQKYPAYSSKPVNGKPLFLWAREGKLEEIEIPEHEVSLYRARFLERKEIDSILLLKEIKEKIGKVKGDFRQEEIISKWSDLFEDKKSRFTIDKIEVEVSSGFYIRQFTEDLAEKLSTVALTSHILRTKVGNYEAL